MTVELRITDGVATIRLNRPEVRNALSIELLTDLRSALGQVRDGAAARAVVLAGAGNAFCAGADLTEIPAGAPANVGIRRVRLVAEVLDLILGLEQPSVAAVQGPAVGAGWGLALMCDTCFATPDARFALPEVPKGFRLPSAIIRRLVEVTGPVRAADLVLSGRAIGADEAHATGVAARIVDGAELMASADAFASTLAGRDRAKVAAAKTALRAAAGPSTGGAEFPWIDDETGR